MDGRHRTVHDGAGRCWLVHAGTGWCCLEPRSGSRARWREPSLLRGGGAGAGSCHPPAVAMAPACATLPQPVWWVQARLAGAVDVLTEMIKRTGGRCWGSCWGRCWGRCWGCCWRCCWGCCCGRSCGRSCGRCCGRWRVLQLPGSQSASAGAWCSQKQARHCPSALSSPTRLSLAFYPPAAHFLPTPAAPPTS